MSRALYWCVCVCVCVCVDGSQKTTLKQCWIVVGPPSKTVAQQQPSIGSTPFVCWDAGTCTRVWLCAAADITEKSNNPVCIDLLLGRGVRRWPITGSTLILDVEHHTSRWMPGKHKTFV